MHKHTILGGAALLLALGGIIFLAAASPESAKTPGQGASATLLPAGGYTEHAAYYDIAANYATSTPLAGSANTDAVLLMQQFVSDTIAQFKKDGRFETLTTEDAAMLGFDQGRKEQLQITYLIASSAHTVSYIFTVYEDTLGAHGNIFFRTFTFDTTTGTRLSIADLFTPGNDYLGALSSIARTKLAAELGDFADANMITDGTRPLDQNFQNFFFDNRDLVILFAPYDVAAYAAGPQTLRIPISTLSSLLKPAYQ